MRAIVGAVGVTLALLLPTAGYATSAPYEDPGSTATSFGTFEAPAASAGVPTEFRPQRAGIVGGKPAANHPWLVQFTLNGSHFCGGVLVHPRVVLTAAHCLWSGEYGNWYPNLATMRAFVGRTSATTGGQELAVQGYGAAGNYQPLDAGGSGVNDWGLLLLSSPAPGTPVRIAGAGEQGIWAAGRPALVAGFGDTAYKGTGSPVLKELTVPLLSDSTCGAWDSYNAHFVPSSMLCAGIMAGGAGTCQGDSGGPLTVAAGRGTRRVVGLVSWGNECAKKNFPTVYTRVGAPAISAAITAMVAQGAATYGWTGADAKPVVVGSGATILACEAATGQLKRAQGQIAKTKAKVKKAKAKVKKAKKKGTAQKLKKAKVALAKAKKAQKKKLPKQKKAVTQATKKVRSIC